MSLSKHFRWIVAGGFALLVMASGAWAQESETQGGQDVSFGMKFIWNPGDLLGQAVIFLLLIMSVVVVALVIHFLLQHRKTTIMPEEAVDTIETLLDERRFKEAIEITAEDESVFAQLIHASLSEASNGYGAMERAIEETGDLAMSRRARALEYLSVMGAVGPMLGLFGTVYGMIVAFWTIVEKGGQPNPADLAAGISTALVTTFWGLVVGIPAVAAYTLIRNRLDSLVAETMILCEDLIGRFKPGSKPAKPSGSATPKPKPQD